MASSAKTGLFLRGEPLPSGSRRVRPRIPGPASMRARDALHERWYSLLRFWYVLKVERRSFLYRMRIQLSRNHRVDFGLASATPQNGHLLLNKQTHARILGTQELESDYPASNEIHIEVFLREFDAGERFALLGVGISEQELENLMPSQSEPDADSSTPTPPPGPATGNFK
jgi:hypothetical protein